MKALEEKIREEAVVLSPSVIKVDSFLNHSVDPSFMKDIGEAFYTKFKNEPVTKIITLESSGIAPAVMTGLFFDVPVVFLRKQKSLTLNDQLFTADVYSYTKETTNSISISKEYLSENDHVLIIDDLLANGQALKGMIDIVRESGAGLAGCGIVIEKGFQNGGSDLRKSNIRIESLAIISEMTEETITFSEREED
ncbi:MULTISPECIES: xanthine phosphoribosyltransferase [Salimicrobium]|uniref:Xanthine phosphoribosyltransferase n=3 Tax=Salimicrobium TaxID=351195 RepID=K2HBB9_9BACI|nr:MULTISPECIES: xanthine phosphoribosyltransferase [Salimicrobium]AKG03833.1 xanthine phosphoribosyltransferase [Salimicrobium jeotgali]EKE32855.1 xanthine phosphoribosyltransferase [Salimicrobium jeotgali]MBM7695152.1 xanthine phosphoribosyltransferase [Salimicrobium jeotgali]SDX95133.1 xanthine phosphoribosyltransferase [Salimicrobium album]SIS69108.1 xanthine phosphoribosyltransferase [Salimicrobium salexigens]